MVGPKELITVLIECKDCGKVFEYVPKQIGILPEHELDNGVICEQSGEFGNEIKVRQVENKKRL
jgi:hypothetical protein